MFMPGLVLGRLFDMGYLRIPVFLASVLLVVCTFLTAECTEFWQFLLCQGFGIGVRSLLLGSLFLRELPLTEWGTISLEAGWCSLLRREWSRTGSTRIWDLRSPAWRADRALAERSSRSS